MNQYYAYNIINQLYLSGEYNNEEQILKLFASPEDGIGVGKDGINIERRPIEFPDHITNINGSHIYKLISSKDVDFNNVLLPYSAVNDANWGSFDEDRRWPSGYPIRINDTYELMNVVDYLLCAVEDLWSEINKLKYNTNVISNLWFLKNLVDEPINQIYALSSDIFTKASEYAVILDPKAYYTTLPMPNFGIGTQFFEDDHEAYPISRQVTSLKINQRNGVLAYIEREDKTTYDRIQNENIGGQIINIYGYRIGTDLHFYPMFNIDNYLYNAAITEDYFSDLVNTEQMKLNYNLYFRRVYRNIDGTTYSEFKKVYVDFLYNDFTALGSPYILYFIDEETQKRNIIYIHTSSSGKTVQAISNDLKKYDEYINYFYNTNLDLSEFGEERSVYRITEGVKYPYLFYDSDACNVTLFVQTPNSPNFGIANDTLPINYYKNSNNLSMALTINNGIIINSFDDLEQQKNGIKYSPIRYNIPDNADVNIDIFGTFLDNNSLIKFDDEYTDVLVKPNPSGDYLSNDYNTSTNKYYYYSNLESGTGKRIFTKFETKEQFNNFFDTSSATTLLNIDSIRCAHVYLKNDDAYKLRYELNTNSLIQQITDYSVVKEQVNNILDTITFTKDSDKYSFGFHYELPKPIEQIKFDINFIVDETSKVSASSLNIPISLNKIHKPCIQFIGKALAEKEINNYTDNYAYTFADVSNNVPYYKLVNKKIDNLIKQDAVTDEMIKTNQNVMQGDTDDDKFIDFKEVYSYLINYKYNDFKVDQFTGASKRSDLLLNINNSNIALDSSSDTLEDTFNIKTTYDNTISNGNMLVFSYNPVRSNMNIIGSGEIFRNYLKSISEDLGNTAKTAFIDNLTYSPQVGVTQNIEFDSIFNINGLGFNYRLHGGDSYLYINREGSGIGSHNSQTDFSFSSQYDLLSNYCMNDINNLVRKLNIQLEDDNHQFRNVNVNAENVEDGNIKLVENPIIDIYGTSYMIYTQCDYHRMEQQIDIKHNYLNDNPERGNWTTSYYVPITYMNIKSTTFFPDKNILPDSEDGYDLNDPNDVEKYYQYIKYWWSSDPNKLENTKYKPITLSLKLNENITNNVPFFYESNTAKVQFNVRRIAPTNTDSYGIGGATVNLCLGMRYYLSDLIYVRLPEGASYNSEFLRMCCVGSYPIYNAQTGLVTIKEFYELGSNSLYPIPILKTIGNKYLYDIEKCARINKIHFNKESIRVNSSVEIASLPDIDVEKLFYIDISEQLMEVLNYDVNELRFALTAANPPIYGNKIYTDNNVTSFPNITISIINRIIPSQNPITFEIFSDYTPDDGNGHSGLSVPIKTNKDLDADDTFIFYTSGTEFGKFKHYQGFTNETLSNKELLVIPDLSNGTNSNYSDLYVYNTSSHTMASIGNQYQNGVKTEEEFEAFYKMLYMAFLGDDGGPKLYQRIS